MRGSVQPVCLSTQKHSVVCTQKFAFAGITCLLLLTLYSWVFPTHSPGCVFPPMPAFACHHGGCSPELSDCLHATALKLRIGPPPAACRCGWRLALQLLAGARAMSLLPRFARLPVDPAVCASDYLLLWLARFLIMSDGVFVVCSAWCYFFRTRSSSLLRS